MKKFKKKLFRVPDNCQLVHPVHEWMTFLNNALKLTVDAGDQLIARKQVRWVDRHFFGVEEVGFDPVFLELGPVYEIFILKLFDNPGTFTAVNSQFFPELALENTFRFRLDQFQCFINRICHGIHLL